MPVYLNCAKKKRKSMYCDMYLDFQYEWFKCTRKKWWPYPIPMAQIL